MPISNRLQTQVTTAVRDIAAVKTRFPSQSDTNILLMLILCELRTIVYKLCGTMPEWPEDST